MPVTVYRHFILDRIRGPLILQLQSHNVSYRWISIPLLRHYARWILFQSLLILSFLWTVLWPETQMFTTYVHKTYCNLSMQSYIFLYEHMCHHHHHHHQSKLLSLEHRALVKCFQLFHVCPTFKAPFSTTLFQEILGHLQYQVPWGFESNAILSTDPVVFLRVYPIQCKFLLFVWSVTGWWFMISHSSSFDILSDYVILITVNSDLFAAYGIFSG